MSPRLLLAVWTAHGNLGDDLLADSARSILAGYEVATVLDPGETARPSDTAGVWPTDREMLTVRGRERIRALGRSHDALVLLGGFLSDDRGPRNMLRWASRVQLLDLPIVTMGCGFGPFDGRLGRRLAARVGSRMVAPASFRTAADCNDFDRLMRSAPSVLSMDPASALDTGPTGKRCGTIISLAPIRAHHRATVSFETAYATLMELLPQVPQPARFLSFQRAAPGVEDDATYWRSLGLEVMQVTDWTVARDLLRETQLTIAGRLHAGLLAATQGSDVLSVSYHRKFDAMSVHGVRTLTWGDLCNGRMMVPDQPLSADRNRREAFLGALKAQLGAL